MALIGTMKYLTIGDKTYEIEGEQLSIASSSTLGGIKVGSGLSIDSTTGVLSTSITETDPVFSASAAAGITSTDISNWNSKVSDTGKWNDVSLNKTPVSETGKEKVYVPLVTSTSSTTAYLMEATFSNGTKAGSIARYNANSYLISTTPSANDNSTKVATTAYVDAAIPDVSGFITSDSDTTYTLSNALSSHKFTSTLTAGGSGSGTSTATMEFVAGTGITLTDDTTNKKITIASSVVNTDEKVKTISYSADDTGHPIVFNTTSSAATTETKQASSNFTFSANSSNYYTLRIGVSASAKGRIWINTGDGDSGNGTYLVSSSTGGKTLTLPDATGTLALASQIPSIYNSSTNPSGYLTMATLPIYDGTVV